MKYNCHCGHSIIEHPKQGSCDVCRDRNRCEEFKEYLSPNMKLKEKLLGKIEDHIYAKDKPLLNPRNNREYWLFTEYWQLVSDFFNNLEKSNLDDFIDNEIEENKLRESFEKGEAEERRKNGIW